MNCTFNLEKFTFKYSIKKKVKKFFHHLKQNNNNNFLVGIFLFFCVKSDFCQVKLLFCFVPLQWVVSIFQTLFILSIYLHSAGGASVCYCHKSHSSNVLRNCSNISLFSSFLPSFISFESSYYTIEDSVVTELTLLSVWALAKLKKKCML